MPHVFDSGGAKAQRTLIREAIIKRLGVLLKTADPARYIPHGGIRPLPQIVGVMNEDGELSMLEHFFNGAAPGIGVALGRMTFDPGGLEATSLLGELPVAVYIGTQHGRDFVDGRLAADKIATSDLTADPGLETILEHVIELLGGQSIEVCGVSELRVEYEDPSIAVFANWTVGEVRLMAKVAREIKPWRDVTQLATEVEHRLSADAIPDDEPGYDPLITTLTTLED